MKSGQATLRSHPPLPRCDHPQLPAITTAAQSAVLLDPVVGSSTLARPYRTVSISGGLSEDRVRSAITGPVSSVRVSVRSVPDLGRR